MGLRDLLGNGPVAFVPNSQELLHALGAGLVALVRMGWVYSNKHPQQDQRHLPFPPCGLPSTSLENDCKMLLYREAFSASSQRFAGFLKCTRSFDFKSPAPLAVMLASGSEA